MAKFIPIKYKKLASKYFNSCAHFFSQRVALNLDPSGTRYRKFMVKICFESKILFAQQMRLGTKLNS